MANNIVRSIVDVVTKGAGRARKELKDVSNATQKVADANISANTAADRHFDTQAKGVIGTANSTRSFSKLAQTLNGGGSSSVVHAYATLMANVFALTAAFNALRSAAQMQQVEAGLRALGDRTGSTLTVAAKGLKEVTGNAISTEQAMRSSAQVFSAGFSTKQLERLGKVATDASFALGREMTDSMDRLTRGVIKLEPELLDELGIMTRLGDATAAYAVTLGKSESSLTQAERRQAFFNAVMAEGEAKFGGLSKEAGNTKSFDQLAASLSDLTKTVLNFINVAALPLAKIFSASPLALAGAAVLFGSTIKDSLLPGLNNLQSRAVKVASAYKDMAKEQLKAVKLAKEQAEIKDESDFLQATGVGPIRGLGKNTDYGKFVEALKVDDDSALTDGRREKAVASLDKALAKATASLSKMRVEDEAHSKTVARINQIQAARTALSYNQATADKLVAEAKERVVRAEAEYRKMSGISTAQTAGAAAIEAASLRDYGEAYNKLGSSVKQYNTAQMQTLKGSSLVSRSMVAIRTGAFAASVGVRVLAAAFVNLIPVLGQIIFAVGIFTAAWEAFKPKGLKELEKDFKALSEITDSAANKQKEYNKLVNLQSAGSYVQAMELRSNAVRELSEAYSELVKTSTEAAKQGEKNTDVANLFEAGFGGKNDFLSRKLNIRRDDQGSQIFDLVGQFELLDKESQAALKTLDATLRVSGDVGEEIFQAAGGFKSLTGVSSELRNARIADIIRDIDKAVGDAGSKVKALETALKDLNTSLGAFSKSSIPTTPYDKIVNDFNAVFSSITKINNAMILGNKGLEDWSRTLEGVSTNTSSFFSVDAANNLQKLQEAVVKVDAISAISEDKRTQAQREQLATSKALLSTRNQVTLSVQEELTRVRELFVEAQNQDRMLKSQMALQQAINKANQANYQTTAEGRRAQIADEEKMRGLEIKGLETQKALLAAQALQIKAQIEQLKTQVGMTEELRKTNQEALLLAQTTAQTALIRAKDKEETLKAERAGMTGIQAAIQGTDRQVAAATAAREATQKLYDTATEELAKNLAAQEKLTDLNITLREVQAGQLQLANQIAAIAQDNLTAEQKIAEINKVRVEQDTERLNTLKGMRDVVADIATLEISNHRLRSGRGATLREELADIERARVSAETAAKATTTANIANLQAGLVQARANGSRAVTDEQKAANAALVRSLEERITLERQSGDMQLRKIQLESENQALQKTSFDILQQGVDWQKESVSLLEKEAESRSNIASSLETIRDAETQIATKRRGVELTQAGSRAAEIESASRQLTLLKQQAEFRKAMVNLEFALLDAQRELLKEQLAERRAVAVSNFGESDPRVKVLDAAIQNLQRDVSGARALAIEAINREVQASEAQLRAMTTRQRVSSNQTSTVLAALEDRRREIEAIRGANDVLKAQNAASQARVETDLKLPFQQALESSVTGVLESIDANIAKLTENLAKVVQTATATPVNTDIIQEAGDYAQSQGFRVSENSRFGGTGSMHRGAAHREDRALDINIDKGNDEFYNREQRAKVERLMADYKKKYGDAVEFLWGEKDGHVDHLHVQFTKAAVATAKAIAQSTSTVAAAIAKTVPVEEITQLEDIVVSASRDTKLNAPKVPELKPLEVRMPSVVEQMPATYEEAFGTMIAYVDSLNESLTSLGEGGIAVSAFSTGALSIIDSVRTIGDVFDQKTSSIEKFQTVAAASSQILSSIGSMVTASSDATVANIDREIAAEQKRDGKSAESLAKIQSLERQRDAGARKAFALNKKLKMAEASISVAAAIAGQLSAQPVGPWNIALAAAMGAVGAAQIAAIASTSYNGGASSASNVTSATPTLSIGKRGESVDLARNNANAGGEIGYLRGAKGIGRNASDYNVIGSAYGGDLPRGYGNTAFAVGEHGPEIITPETPITVRPMSDSPAAAPVSAEININTLDARGVEEILYGQRGNIIGMLREAANANGQSFLEDVNVNVYTKPNVGRL